MDKNKPKNLIDAWITVSRIIQGRTLTDAIRDLNAATGKSFDLSRVSEWRCHKSIKRCPPPEAIRYMAQDVAAYAVQSVLGLDPSRFTDEQLLDLAYIFTPPPRAKNSADQ